MFIIGIRYIVQQDYNHKMKPGPKPKGKVRCSWSPEFAYAIGLLTADGCLSGDGRHIDFTSKDRDQVSTFQKCLGISMRISPKWSGQGRRAYHVQFGDVLFYQFLMTIGLMPAKSKKLQSLAIPRKYLFDFVRGLFDGDGCSYSFYDSLFEKSFRFYVSFASASPPFLYWLRESIQKAAGIRGHFDRPKSKSYLNLKYSKREALILIEKMYYQTHLPHLRRKRLKILRSLQVIHSINAQKGQVRMRN
jgi:hypothetical protein